MGEAMRDVELQKLVDQHAIYGMTHQEIKQHLYEQHGVDKKTHIPPISKRGIEARNFFFQNRRLPDWYDDKFGKDFVKAEELTADDIDEIISITPDDFSGERGTLSFNEISERKLINTDNLYSKNHPTSLDRFFFTKMRIYYHGHGMEYLQAVVNTLYPVDPSPYCIFEKHYKEFIQRYQNYHSFNLHDVHEFTSKMKKYDSDESFEVLFHDMENIYGNKNTFLFFYYKAIGVELFFRNWILDKKESTTLQLKNTDLNDLLSSRELIQYDLWENVSKKELVYIDITNKKHGDRYISGIFSAPENGQIHYCAIVEWQGIDFQGTIEWYDQNLAEDSIMISMMGDSVVDKDISTREYQEIAAFAQRMYKVVLNAEILGLFDKSGSLAKFSSDNKAAVTLSKESVSVDKTRSLFVIQKRELNYMYRESSKERSRQKWTLDHIVGVSGHFRRQYFGVGNGQMKLIWIDPYTRGNGFIETKLDRHLMTKVKILKQ